MAFHERRCSRGGEPGLVQSATNTGSTLYKRLLLAVADLGSHTTLLATYFASTFTTLLNTH